MIDWSKLVYTYFKKYINTQVESLGESHGLEWNLSHVSSFRVGKHTDTLEAVQG